LEVIETERIAPNFQLQMRRFPLWKLTDL